VHRGREALVQRARWLVVGCTDVADAAMLGITDCETSDVLVRDSSTTIPIDRDNRREGDFGVRLMPTNNDRVGRTHGVLDLHPRRDHCRESRRRESSSTRMPFPHRTLSSPRACVELASISDHE